MMKNILKRSALRVVSSLAFFAGGTAIYATGASAALPSQGASVSEPLPIKIDMQERRSWSFDDGAVVFDNQFSGARLQDVVPAEGEDAARGVDYIIMIDREGKSVGTPPWYAFAVSTSEPREVTMRLRYGWNRHLHNPRLRYGEDGQWEDLPASALRPVAKGKELIFTVELKPGKTFIAPREFTTVKMQDEWTRQLAERPGVSLVDCGKSVAGQLLLGLETRAASKDAPSVLLMTWQHPPEMSGVFSFRAFVETLLGDSEQAKAFRKNYSLLIVPMANPDGVDEGTWRHNFGDVDLNRDWRNFSQPETRAIRDFFVTANRPVLFIDFHSTYKTLLYTAPDGSKAEGALPGFSAAWCEALAKHFDGKAIERISSHNKNAATSSAWARNTFGATAITLEVAQSATREESTQFGTFAAVEMMRLLAGE